MLRKLFYVSASLLMLAAAYHLGASTAGAQSGGSNVVSGFVGGGAPIAMLGGVVTASGDVYVTPDWVSWTHTSNVFSGPTPARQSSWGALKVNSH